MESEEVCPGGFRVADFLEQPVVAAEWVLGVPLAEHRVEEFTKGGVDLDLSCPVLVPAVESHQGSSWQLCLMEARHLCGKPQVADVTDHLCIDPHVFRNEPATLHDAPADMEGLALDGRVTHDIPFVEMYMQSNASNKAICLMVLLYYILK